MWLGWGLGAAVRVSAGLWSQGSSTGMHSASLFLAGCRLREAALSSCHVGLPAWAEPTAWRLRASKGERETLKPCCALKEGIAVTCFSAPSPSEFQVRPHSRAGVTRGHEDQAGGRILEAPEEPVCQLPLFRPPQTSLRSPPALTQHCLHSPLLLDSEHRTLLICSRPTPHPCHHEAGASASYPPAWSRAGTDNAHGTS